MWIFGQPQRFLVTLFQRRYVWNKEQQWEPLWRDLERVSLRLLNDAQTKHQPHFLGAVVLQQVQTRVGELQARIIIGGFRETPFGSSTSCRKGGKRHGQHQLQALFTSARSPWAGKNGKKAAFRRHDLLLLNRDLDSFSTADWTDDSINSRTGDLINTILDIWPVPPGYKIERLCTLMKTGRRIGVSSLLRVDGQMRRRA